MKVVALVPAKELDKPISRRQICQNISRNKMENENLAIKEDLTFSLEDKKI